MRRISYVPIPQTDFPRHDRFSDNRNYIFNILVRHIMKNSDKSAYPLQGHNYDAPDEGWYHVEHEEGLTKREAFAMAAMQGMLACDKIHDDMNASLKQGGNARIEIARAAINLADSLLKELEEM